MSSRFSLVLGVLVVLGAATQAQAQMRTNLAAGKQAFQSSTAHGGEASRAVDGNVDGAFFNGSVTHTEAGPNEWWMVDLGGSYDIRGITIFNRTDCCAERLDARVMVSTTRRPQSAVFERALGSVGQRAELAVGAVGRYVWVLQNSANHLQLAEVVVRGSSSFSPPAVANLAEGRQAFQSSTSFGGEASRAVDGNTDGAFNNGSVTHTEAGPDEWWMVDLGSIQEIGSITLHNRADCCGERLDARVVVTASRGLGSPVFLRQLGRVGASVTVPVAARGRYVWVVQNSANHLQLAEVVVRGSRRSRPAAAFGNVAAGKRAMQSSTAFAGEASRAVDGNVDGAFNHGSVTHTDAGASEWWMVDLGAPHEIRGITIFNRTDCCSERLDARVMVTTTRGLESGVFQAELGRVGERVDLQVGGAVGRYVWVLQNSANHLQLTEVVVQGRPR